MVQQNGGPLLLYVTDSLLFQVGRAYGHGGTVVHVINEDVDPASNMFVWDSADVGRSACFGKSRDVGCYLGLQPGRRQSGKSDPQMHITKEGDPYLRTLLVQGAQHILGPFGVDCDLRRWGLKLAERGGRNAKKRAIIATARKLAVL